MSRRSHALADLATAAVAVAVAVEQSCGPGTLRLVALRATWWTAARVASAAGRVALAAEDTYRREVSP